MQHLHANAFQSDLILNTDKIEFQVIDKFSHEFPHLNIFTVYCRRDDSKLITKPKAKALARAIAGATFYLVEIYSTFWVYVNVK